MGLPLSFDMTRKEFIGTPIPHGGSMTVSAGYRNLVLINVGCEIGLNQVSNDVAIRRKRSLEVHL